MSVKVSTWEYSEKSRRISRLLPVCNIRYSQIDADIKVNCSRHFREIHENGSSFVSCKPI